MSTLEYTDLLHGDGLRKESYPLHRDIKGNGFHDFTYRLLDYYTKTDSA